MSEASNLGVFTVRASPAAEALLDAGAMPNGVLQAAPATFYCGFQQQHLSAWCVQRGLYSLPTFELADMLRGLIGDGSAIEIGAGHGALGRALRIPTTDSRNQERPDVAAFYKQCGQAVTVYPPHVEKLTAIEAVDKYQPSVVLGAWLTHRWDDRYPERRGNPDGIDAAEVLDRACVRRLIMVAHERVHKHEPLLERRHTTLRPQGILFARPLDIEGNVIRVWEKTDG